jgi:hypothetical protein
MNAYEQYQIQVDDVPVHFMRKPGVGPNPTPLILPMAGPGRSGTKGRDCNLNLQSRPVAGAGGRC